MLTVLVGDACIQAMHTALLQGLSPEYTVRSQPLHVTAASLYMQAPLPHIAVKHYAEHQAGEATLWSPRNPRMCVLAGAAAAFCRYAEQHCRSSLHGLPANTRGAVNQHMFVCAGAAAAPRAQRPTCTPYPGLPPYERPSQPAYVCASRRRRCTLQSSNRTSIIARAARVCRAQSTLACLYMQALLLHIAVKHQAEHHRMDCQPMSALVKAHMSVHAGAAAARCGKA